MLYPSLRKNKRLLAFLVMQSLMTPYLSILLSPLVEQLRGSDHREEGSIGPTGLCVVQTLTKSMNVDEGGPYRQRSDSIYHRRLTFTYVSLPNMNNSVLAR